MTILEGQPVYANFLASQAQGGQFSILEPGETIGPDSEAWRAVSLTVPDDRAVGGLVRPGDTVDVFVTTTVTVPDDLAAAGKYYTDKSTKITYQDLVVLAKASTFYVMKVPAAIAEEISHLQASGAAAFSLALRPPDDDRTVDASRLGETTNLIIQRYGLPIPQPYPPGRGAVVAGPARRRARRPSPSRRSGPRALARGPDRRRRSRGQRRVERARPRRVDRGRVRRGRRSCRASRVADRPGPLDQAGLRRRSGGPPRPDRRPRPASRSRWAALGRRRPARPRRADRRSRPRRAGSPRGRPPGRRVRAAASSAARRRGRIAGWVIASSARSSAGSSKTRRPRAARSSEPSGARTSGPNRATIAAERRLARARSPRGPAGRRR